MLHNESVTALPILFPLAKNEPDDGQVFWQGSGENRKVSAVRFVKRFVLERTDLGRFPEFAQLAQLVDLARAGKPIDYQLLEKEDFRALIAETFAARLNDALIKQWLANPQESLRRFLPAIFNREIKRPEIVMWWPRERGAMFGPAIYCRSRETALLVALLFSNIRWCPGCKELFVRGARDDQRFHSINCATKYRMKRYRYNKGAQRRKIRKKGKGHE